jgi:hypothetical protein
LTVFNDNKRGQWMCIICIEYGKKLITRDEAWRILSEMSSDVSKKHLAEIEALIEEERDYDDT